MKLQLIQHLYTTYGRIMPGDLTKNTQCIWAPYGPSLLIETLFDQIEDAVDLAAAANAPYTPSMVINIAYQTVFTTVLFYDACCDWRRRPVIQKTLANFKTDFALAHQKLVDSQATTCTGSFHAVNLVEIYQDICSPITVT